MKARADKAELQMRRSEYGPLQWSLAGPAPGTAARFRRWNFVLITILIFLVLGAFVAAEAPRTASNTHALLKDSESPGSVQPAKSKNGTSQPVRGRGASGNLSEVKSGHHAG